jgi:predicted HAD superfamily Cof-like phosphohydrolase
MIDTNFDRTKNWLLASLDGAGRPVDKVAFGVQLGCFLEEVAELVSSVELGNIHSCLNIGADVNHFATLLKKGIVTVKGANPVDLADAIADVKVTADGLAAISGFDQNAIDNAVLASNEAKLVNGKPVILDGGKIGKPNGWQAPCLKPFVVDCMWSR